MISVKADELKSRRFDDNVLDEERHLLTERMDVKTCLVI